RNPTRPASRPRSKRVRTRSILFLRRSVNRYPVRSAGGSGTNPKGWSLRSITQQILLLLLGPPLNSAKISELNGPASAALRFPANFQNRPFLSPAFRAVLQWILRGQGS